jgi:transcriptional regulator with XRE-family HTH domain
MKPKATPATDVFTTNLEIVMKARGWTLPQWAEKSGVSKRALQYYLEQGRAPALDTLQKLADAARIEVWVLLFPDLTPQMVKSGELKEVGGNYAHASPETQAYVRRALTLDIASPKSA